MTSDRIDALWRWSNETYARPGVKTALLALQDQFGAPVPLLLWAAHAASNGFGVSQEDARAARSATAAIAAQVRALRDARRQAPLIAADLPEDLHKSAARSAGEAEIAFERLELARLAVDMELSQAPHASAEDNIAAALKAAGLDLNQRDAKAAHHALCAALAG